MNKVSKKDIIKLKNLIIMLDLQYRQKIGQELDVEGVNFLLDSSKMYKEFSPIDALYVINRLYENQKE